MTELTKSLEFIQDGLLEEEINNIKENNKNFETSVQGIEDDLLNPNVVSSKLVDLEDRSRRNKQYRQYPKNTERNLGKFRN